MKRCGRRSATAADSWSCTRRPRRKPWHSVLPVRITALAFAAACFTRSERALSCVRPSRPAPAGGATVKAGPASAASASVNWLRASGAVGAMAVEGGAVARCPRWCGVRGEGLRPRHAHATAISSGVPRLLTTQRRSDPHARPHRQRPGATAAAPFCLASAPSRGSDQARTMLTAAPLVVAGGLGSAGKLVALGGAVPSGLFGLTASGRSGSSQEGKAVSRPGSGQWRGGLVVTRAGCAPPRTGSGRSSTATRANRLELAVAGPKTRKRSRRGGGDDSGSGDDDSGEGGSGERLGRQGSTATGSALGPCPRAHLHTGSPCTFWHARRLGRQLERRRRRRRALGGRLEHRWPA